VLIPTLASYKSEQCSASFTYAIHPVLSGNQSILDRNPEGKELNRLQKGEILCRFPNTYSVMLATVGAGGVGLKARMLQDSIQFWKGIDLKWILREVQEKNSVEARVIAINYYAYHELYILGLHIDRLWLQWTQWVRTRTCGSQQAIYRA
jgi:hypothetical protein